MEENNIQGKKKVEKIVAIDALTNARRAIRTDEIKNVLKGAIDGCLISLIYNHASSDALKVAGIIIVGFFGIKHVGKLLFELFLSLGITLSLKGIKDEPDDYIYIDDNDSNVK